MPHVIAGDLLAAVLSNWGLYALIGLAFALNFRIGGFFDLSVGASFMLGGYLTWTLARWLPVPIAAAAAIGAATLVAVVVGYRFIAPIALRLPPLNLFVLTLGLLYFTEAMLSIVFGVSPEVLQGGPNSISQFLGMSFSSGQLGLFLAGLIATAVVSVLYQGTAWGRVARAIADDRRLAHASGLPIRFTLLATYAAGGGLAGLAGALFVNDQALNPSQSLSTLLAAMVASIIGGESVLGAAVGALILAVLEVSLGYLLPGNWRSTVVFLVLLVVLIARRGGAFKTERRTF